jgi:hypothetical protein
MMSPVIIPAAAPPLVELDLLKWNELLGPVMLPVTVWLESATPAPWNLIPKYFQAKK